MFRSKQCFCLCGLWEWDLPLSLLWYAGKGTFKEWKTENVKKNVVAPGIRPSKYHAPTWSWASIDGKIYHHRPSKPILSLSSVGGVTCTPEGSNPFERCTDGTLEICGHIIEVYAASIPQLSRLTFHRKKFPSQLSSPDLTYFFAPDTTPLPSR